MAKQVLPLIVADLLVELVLPHVHYEELLAAILLRKPKAIHPCIHRLPAIGFTRHFGVFPLEIEFKDFDKISDPVSTEVQGLPPALIAIGTHTHPWRFMDCIRKIS
jgi:hypothetical protein